MSLAQSVAITMIHLCHCGECGLPIMVPSVLEHGIRNNGKEFHCCNGHCRVYRETEADKLKKQLAAKDRDLAAANARATMAERSRDAHKGKVTEIRNRIHNGVCPCCKRSFTNLRRHMSTKHPDFKDEP